MLNILVARQIIMEIILFGSLLLLSSSKIKYLCARNSLLEHYKKYIKC